MEVEKLKNTKKKIFSKVLVFFLTFAISALLFFLFWVLKTWGYLTMDEIVYHFKTTIDGTSKSMIIEAIMYTLVPSTIVVAASASICHFTKKYQAGKLVLLLVTVCMIVETIVIWNKWGVSEYLENMNTPSSFIEDEYVNPKDVKITFPEKKRNLIYIYLESMETTYADKENGGSFDVNIIPELTKIAQENEDFSGEDDNLNGGYALRGNTWTIGAMFGHTTGLPLSIPIDGNEMESQRSFFPEITSMGDILADNGYKNVLMIGSDATFGGRRLYFSTHGDYEILDYVYAKKSGLIPDDYYVFWGYEDKKLFEYAKDELLNLSNGDEPFNLTLLTVDTHFSDGYICEECSDEFSEQYSNVMACSSRRISEFLEWLKKQDFYENTTVVLCGDHLTMSSSFNDQIEKDYQRRTYTAFINSAVNAKNNDKREYSTLDYFPTTIESLGAVIDGHKLGLGTSLFSDKKTLVEEYGIDYLNTEFLKKSNFMSSLQTIEYQPIADQILLDIIKKKEKNNSLTLQYQLSDVKTQVPITESYITFIDKKGNTIERVKSKTINSKKQIFEATCSKDVQNVYGIYLEINFDGKDELLLCSKTYTAIEIDEAKGMFNDYFNAIYNSEDYYMFISIKDEGTGALYPSNIQALQQFGLTANLKDNYRTSYLAVVCDGKVIEEMQDYSKLETTGTMINGSTYYIESSGHDCGLHSSIIIDDVEYCLDDRGMNIVIYNYKINKVVDIYTYDTFKGGSFLKNGFLGLYGY